MKKILSINEFGEIEKLSKKEFKLMKLGINYIIADVSVKNKIFYLPHHEFLYCFSNSGLNSDYKYLVDFMGNVEILMSGFRFAGIYSKLRATMFLMFGFKHKNLKIVECSRYLNRYLEDIN